MKYIEISLMEDGELSIDGQSKPAGNLDIREYEDGEEMGGGFFKTITEAEACVREYQNDKK